MRTERKKAQDQQPKPGTTNGKGGGNVGGGGGGLPEVGKKLLWKGTKVTTKLAKGSQRWMTQRRRRLEVP